MPKAINIQAGATSDQFDKIPVKLVCATCEGLGIFDLTVRTEEKSNAALDLLDVAISKVSAFRSDFGAVQNRLEHGYNIDLNTAENTQYAESQIRDTDMAEEMVKYSSANILCQTAQSLLAQANQISEGVLSLIV